MQRSEEDQGRRIIIMPSDEIFDLQSVRDDEEQIKLCNFRTQWRIYD